MHATACRLLHLDAQKRRAAMIRKLKSGQYRLYSKKRDKSGKRKNLGTFGSREAAEKHERAVQYFKRH
jgi:hypothetical protein